MNIRIQNFGPIRYFKFDLDKDLHLIVGSNNIGKSYAITVVYLILKSFLSSVESLALLRYLFDREKDSSGKVPGKIKNIKYSEELCITDDCVGFVKNTFNNIFVQNFNENIRGTYDSIADLHNIYNDEDTLISLDFDNASIDIGIDSDSFKTVNVYLYKDLFVKCIKQNRKFKETDSQIILYHNHNNDKLFLDNFNNCMLKFYRNITSQVRNTVKSVHYLPASRSGLYQALTAFGQIVAQLSKRRPYFNEKMEIPALSIPLSDYFIELSSIKVGKNDFGDNPFNEIASKIESDILNGMVEFSSKEKKLFYTPYDSDLKIDIRSASSMVSEVSPIVSFIRHVLAKPTPKNDFLNILGVDEKTPKGAKPIIFIEEPEAHLHPENQIKLLNIFIDLLGCKVKLIVTSHSNYIFNKINNLILSGSLKIDDIEAIILKYDDHGSKAEVLPTDEFGIDDENFIDVSEELYAEKLYLINNISNND